MNQWIDESMIWWRNLKSQTYQLKPKLHLPCSSSSRQMLLNHFLWLAATLHQDPPMPCGKEKYIVSNEWTPGWLLGEEWDICLRHPSTASEANFSFPSSDAYCATYNSRSKWRINWTKNAKLQLGKKVLGEINLQLGCLHVERMLVQNVIGICWYHNLDDQDQVISL